MTNTIFVTETSPKDTKKSWFAQKKFHLSEQLLQLGKKKKKKVFCAQNLLEAVTDSVLSVQQVPAL